MDYRGWGWTIGGGVDYRGGGGGGLYVCMYSLFQ